MDWPAVVLGALNVFQACFIAWLTVRAEQTHREVHTINGQVARVVRSDLTDY